LDSVLTASRDVAGRQALFVPGRVFIVAAMAWNIDSARRQYNLAGWSGGYFDVGGNGRLLVRPRGMPDSPEIDLHELVEHLHTTGLTLPVLLRFTDILRSRVDRLHAAFAAALRSADSDARYTAIYPVKVNQQEHVVDAIVAHGGDRVGLECGSKPELMIVIGSLQPGGVIICNGYKDAEYIRLALIAQRLGHRVMLVIEKLSELELILRTQATGRIPVASAPSSASPRPACWRCWNACARWICWTAWPCCTATRARRSAPSMSFATPCRRWRAAGWHCARRVRRLHAWTWVAASALTTRVPPRPVNARSTTMWITMRKPSSRCSRQWCVSTTCRCRT
jgi:hypothetical protein